MNGIQTRFLILAVAAALVAVVGNIFAYYAAELRVQTALVARLEQAAELGANAVDPQDLTEARRLGVESNAFWDLMGQLDYRASVMGVGNLALIDSTRHTVYDVQLGNRGQHSRSSYDSLASAAVTRALGGLTTVAVVRRGQEKIKAAFAPVRIGKRVLGVVIAEAPRTAPMGRTKGFSYLFWQVLMSLFSVFLIVVAGLRVTLDVKREQTLKDEYLTQELLIRDVHLMKERDFREREKQQERDFREREKQQERDFREREQQLQREVAHAESRSLKINLTAELAHEVNNPLAIIRGSARRLGKLQPEAERMAESVVEEVDRLTRTVARYLDWASGGHREDGCGDASAAISKTLDLLEGKFRERGCMLERKGLDAPALVRLEADVIKQLSYNLVLNALQAVPDGGFIRVMLASGQHEVEIRVEDNGPGIPPDVLPHVGDPFFTTKPEGTGLGLNMVRREAEAAGGTLRVESEIGQGTKVIVRLPLALG